MRLGPRPSGHDLRLVGHAGRGAFEGAQPGTPPRLRGCVWPASARAPAGGLDPAGTGSEPGAADSPFGYRPRSNPAGRQGDRNPGGGLRGDGAGERDAVISSCRGFFEILVGGRTLKAPYGHYNTPAVGQPVGHSPAPTAGGEHGSPVHWALWVLLSPLFCFHSAFVCVCSLCRLGQCRLAWCPTPACSPKGHWAVAPGEPIVAQLASAVQRTPAGLAANPPLLGLVRGAGRAPWPVVWPGMANAAGMP
jgi:hypothetical protein